MKIRLVFAIIGFNQIRVYNYTVDRYFCNGFVCKTEITIDATESHGSRDGKRVTVGE